MYRFEYEMCIVFYFFINETLNTSDFKPTSTENRPVKKSILPGNTYTYICYNGNESVCLSVCVDVHVYAFVCIKAMAIVCVQFIEKKINRIMYNRFVYNLQCGHHSKENLS